MLTVNGIYLPCHCHSWMCACKQRKESGVLFCYLMPYSFGSGFLLEVMLSVILISPKFVSTPPPVPHPPPRARLIGMWEISVAGVWTLIFMVVQQAFLATEPSLQPQQYTLITKHFPHLYEGKLLTLGDHMKSESHEVLITTWIQWWAGQNAALPFSSVILSPPLLFIYGRKLELMLSSQNGRR